MSARSLRLVLTPEAQADLRDVLIVTEQRWGRARRQSYRRRFSETFSSLARFPDLGRARRELGPGIRSHRTGQHVVIYRAVERELRILRVLDVRRDIEGEFDGTSA